MWGKYFIIHIILVAAQDAWHLWSLFYHHAHTHTPALFTQISFRVIVCETRRHACCTHVVRFAAWVSIQVHSHVMCITWFGTQFINSDVETLPFSGNMLSEYNPAFEFYNFFVHWQMFWGVIEFSISLVECFKRLSLFSMVGHIPRLGWVSVSL
jgi:hypothetical protein